MKGKRKTLLALLCAICVLCIAFAFGCAAEKTYYTVTFMDGATVVGTAEVEKGKKIESYPTPSRTDADFVFDGWRKDEALEIVWNHDIERVNADITLYANFLYVSATPNNASMDKDVAFSNTLVWLQRGINTDTEFSVELYRGVKISADGYAYEDACEYKEENLKGSAGNIVLEQYKDHADIFTVKWTPDEKPVGGYFAAKISCGEASARVEGLLFKGAGTQDNPYLIPSATDLSA
ncbi:MAG: InlB B-repeat-containing protein, partial [Clostridia bacterium]|nr:InlB B-repeat-containing protein [Clostridia bacterium]